MKKYKVFRIASHISQFHEMALWAIKQPESFEAEDLTFIIKDYNEALGAIDRWMESSGKVALTEQKMSDEMRDKGYTMPDDIHDKLLEASMVGTKIAIQNFRTEYLQYSLGKLQELFTDALKEHHLKIN